VELSLPSKLTDKKAEIQYSKVYQPVNQTQAIELNEIVQPFKRPNAADLRDALRRLQGVGFSLLITVGIRFERALIQRNN